MFGTGIFVRRVVPAFLIGAAIALSGCTVQPLYATAPDGTTLRTDLSAISIAPANDRPTQVIRNELIFAFTGGGAPALALYELSVVSEVSGGTGNIVDAGAIPTDRVAINASYVLAEIATGRVITAGSVRTETAYNRSNQAFATLRAEEEAEERAAIEAARQIRARIEIAMAAEN